MYKSLEDLEPCDKMPGFYVVPGLNHYSVSTDGRVFNRDTNKFAVITLTNSKDISKAYLTTRGDFSHVHVMVASTFLDNSHLPSDKMKVVNHLNGVKTDNRVENLEWATKSRDMIHAYENGLRPDNIPVLCKDLRTMEITTHYSYWDCARYLRINGSSVHDYIHSQRKNKIFRKHYVLIREGDEWPVMDDEFMNAYYFGLFKEVLIEDKISKQCFIVDSLTQACNIINKSLFHLSKKIRSSIKEGLLVVDLDGFSIMPVDIASEVFRENAKIIKPDHKPRFKTIRVPKRVSVETLETGEVVEWESLEKFADSIYVKKNTVQKHILVNGGYFHNKFKITYID